MDEKSPAAINLGVLIPVNPIVSRLVGVFLETLVRMINARRVFEFGSGYDYSAYWFARAHGSGGICRY
jgi:predicted O-methyltransferase YrrM